jgi:uncharacterized protein with GYD domain
MQTNCKGGEWEMFFVMLNRFRGKATKENIEKANKVLASDPKVKVLGFYWTLGRYDSVLIVEAASEKTVMKMCLQVADFAATETMVAIPREEAIKFM